MPSTGWLTQNKLNSIFVGILNHLLGICVLGFCDCFHVLLIYLFINLFIFGLLIFCLLAYGFQFYVFMDCVYMCCVFSLF